MSGVYSSSSSSSSGPANAGAHIDSPEAAMARIAQLESQLASANATLASTNAEGNRIVALYQAEKAKVQQQAAAAAASRVKVPTVPQFRGEIGFSVDGWLRRLVKHFEFYGEVNFPHDESRIKYAVMFLEGAAMDWWDGLTVADKNKITTWELFVETLYSRFRPMQAATVARIRLAGLKQTGSVAAFINIFQKELTPIRDMSVSDQLHYFRQGLKPQIAQRVLEKLPKSLHEAMDIAILADAHLSKSGINAPQYYQSYNRTGASSSRPAASGNGDAMDISNITTVGVGEDSVRFHREEDDSPPPTDPASVLREYNRMKVELKKFQAQAAISALGSAAAASSSSSSSSNRSSTRIPVSKEEFDYCWKNRLCLKCKKPNHAARDCRSAYQPLN
jgi:hypothetical protein